MRRNCGFAAAAAMLLAGCAIWTPGQDPAAGELMPPAQAVLAALNRYARDHGGGPVELADLVPRYLPALPARPALDYSPKRGTLVFNYPTSWPPGSTTACSAKVGEAAYHCAVYN